MKIKFVMAPIEDRNEGSNEQVRNEWRSEKEIVITLKSLGFEYISEQVKQNEDLMMC